MVPRYFIDFFQLDFGVFMNQKVPETDCGHHLFGDISPGSDLSLGFAELEMNQNALHHLFNEAVMQKSNLRDSSSKMKAIVKALIRRDIISNRLVPSIHHS